MKEFLDAAIFWTFYAVWPALALFLIWWLRVFSPRVLAAAPTRRSTLSLPVVGGVILLYILIQSALVLGAYAGGWLSKEDVGLAEKSPPAATSSSAPASATAASTATVPSTTSAAQPAISLTAKMNLLGAAVYFLILVPILIVIPRFFKHGFTGWGLSLLQLPAGIAKGILGFVVIYPIVFWVSIGVGNLYLHFGHQPEDHPTLVALAQEPPAWEKALLFFVAVGVAPFMEELFFRGILQTTLIQFGWGAIVPQFMKPGTLPIDFRPTVAHRWAAIVLASVAFAMMHQVDHWPILFILSLGFGYLYERTGILWASMTAHAAFNAIELALFLKLI